MTFLRLLGKASQLSVLGPSVVQRDVSVVLHSKMQPCCPNCSVVLQVMSGLKYFMEILSYSTW